jgi:hypothetical protein
VTIEDDGHMLLGHEEQIRSTTAAFLGAHTATKL